MQKAIKAASSKKFWGQGKRRSKTQFIVWATHATHATRLRRALQVVVDQEAGVPSLMAASGQIRPPFNNASEDLPEVLPDLDAVKDSVVWYGRLFFEQNPWQSGLTDNRRQCADAELFVIRNDRCDGCVTYQSLHDHVTSSLSNTLEPVLFKDPDDLRSR